MKGKSVVFLAATLGFVLATLVFSQGMTKAQEADITNTEVTNAATNNAELNAETNATTNATSNEAAPVEPASGY